MRQIINYWAFHQRIQIHHATPMERSPNKGIQKKNKALKCGGYSNLMVFLRYLILSSSVSDYLYITLQQAKYNKLNFEKLAWAQSLCYRQIRNCLFDAFLVLARRGQVLCKTFWRLLPYRSFCMDELRSTRPTKAIADSRQTKQIKNGSRYGPSRTNAAMRKENNSTLNFRK